MKNSAAKKRKQVPSGYLVVGVDPHKKKHASDLPPKSCSSSYVRLAK